jgi:hypothetical protein
MTFGGAGETIRKTKVRPRGGEAMERLSILSAEVGDRLAVSGHHQGEPARDGEILEVLGRNGSPPYVVRWDDGRVSTVYPGSDVFIEHYKSAKAP